MLLKQLFFTKIICHVKEGYIKGCSIHVFVLIQRLKTTRISNL